MICTDQSRIIPYKGAVLDIAPKAKLYIGGGDVEIGCDRLKGSKVETLLRLWDNATWCSEGGCRISYGATIEILQNAVLNARFFTMNSRSVLIAAKNIQLCQDVMIGRNVIIYDSDHHAIKNFRGETTNPDEQIFIGDHVWLATNVTVLKGTNMGSNCVAAANSVVRGTVPPDSLYRADGIRRNYETWSREHPWH